MSLNFCPNSFQHVRTGASFEFQARLATLVYLNSITVQFFDSQAQTADHLFLQSFLSSLPSAWNVKVTSEVHCFFCTILRTRCRRQKPTTNCAKLFDSHGLVTFVLV